MFSPAPSIRFTRRSQLGRGRDSVCPWFMASPSNRPARCGFIRKWAKARACIFICRGTRGSGWSEETEPQVAQAPKAGAGETVLVVDDEPSVRMLIAEVLDELGYSAIEAADGTSALKVLRSDVAHRSPHYRCRPAWWAQRPTDGGCCAGRPSQSEGAVHHRLCRERLHWRRPFGTGHARPDKAVCNRHARRADTIHHCGVRRPPVAR